MSDLAKTVPDGSGRSVSGRDAEVTAAGRCLLYALFSDLVASPFDSEPVVAGDTFNVADLPLPYEVNGLAELLAEWLQIDREDLKREYSGLFEVGSNGPPVPIREDLHRNQPAGLREDIIRFYDFFSYGLDEKFAWAPDHLSIEFEFMHFLCFHEAEQAQEEDGDVLSFQLAQADFAERHLCNWVPELVERINQQQPDAFYGKLFEVISECLLRDFEWQAGTIKE
ncbi:MAG: molecular chaperone TorD family protein [Gammaproteobacteria bacterium]|jgi:DMSO reductase family type II enzyme chaperone|nr:molecular chaperone TorD family protein [Gammaproteobacteria bacterium]MDP6616626.1 molecular chaperone TorD family protein [Gammaproteobacteria bacterium]MDP6694823.1 molecular chaperone TorD family protein [Gammaproteobacteria bacterium]